MGDSNLLRFIHYASRATKFKLVMVFAIGMFIVTGTLVTLSLLWKLYKGPERIVVVPVAPREPASVGHEEEGKLYEIKGVSVGFMDRKDSRMAHAQFTLVFQCGDEPCKKNLLLNHAKVLDALFEVGSDFYIEDFVAPGAEKGFSKFKSKISEKLQQKFTHLAPHGVAIHDWYMN